MCALLSPNPTKNKSEYTMRTWFNCCVAAIDGGTRSRTASANTHTHTFPNDTKHKRAVRAYLCAANRKSPNCAQHITCHTFQWFFSHSHVCEARSSALPTMLAARFFRSGHLSLASIERRAFGQRRNVKLGLRAIEHFNQTEMKGSI